MKQKKSIAKNYLYNLMYQLLTIITPLITTPYLSRVLGAENIGIHGYTISIVTYFILFGSLGVAMYGQREIAYVQKNKEEQSQLFWEINIIRTISYILSIICFYFLFCTHGNYKIYYTILILEMLANAIDITWYFQGIEDFKKTVVRNLIVKLVGLVSIFIFIKTQDDLWKYFAIYVLSDFLGNFTLWLYIPKFINFKIKKIKLKKHIKPIILLFLPQIAIQIYAVLDKTMVGNITKDMIEVGYYDQAQKIIKALLLVVTALSAVMSSRIANSYAEKKHKELKKYILQSIKMVLLFSIPSIFGIIAISDKLVPWYYGKGYEPVVLLMNACSLILLLIGLNNVTGIQYLIQTNQQNKFTISVVIGAIVNVVFNYILINICGTVGAIYSSLLAEFAILFVQLLFMKKILSMLEIIRPSIKYLISGFIMFIIVKYITSLLAISLINTLIEAFVGFVVYIVLLLILKDKFFYDILNQIISVLNKKGIRKR